MKRHALLLLLIFTTIYSFSSINRISGLVSGTALISSSGTVGFSSTSWLHTEGREIKDATGRVVRLVGANVMLANKGQPPGEWETTPPGGSSGGVHRDSVYRVIAEAGANTVRFMIPIRYMAPLPPVPWGADYEQDRWDIFDKVVETCRKYNMQVFFTFTFSSFERSGALDYGEYMEDPIIREQMKEATLKMVDRYKDDPTVVGYNLINEPFDAGSIGRGTDDYWWDLYRDYVADLTPRIHAIQPNLLIILDNMPYGTHPERWEGNLLTDPNVVYTVHIYYHNAKSWENAGSWAYNYKIGNYATGRQILEYGPNSLFRNLLDLSETNNVPVLIGESGIYHWDPIDENWEIVLRDIMELSEQYGIGYINWDISGEDYSSWGMLTSDLQSLNPVGEIWSENLGWTIKVIP